MTNEHDAFLRTILADPADPLPRLVFADWLEETGSRSNLAWSKFLRLSEASANDRRDDPSGVKNARLLGRLGTLIQAKLRYKAEIFVEHPQSLRRVLPLRCMILDVDSVRVPAALSECVPLNLARDYGVVPLSDDAVTLTVAATALPDDEALSLGYLVNRRVEWVTASREATPELMAQAYHDDAVAQFDCVTFTIPFAPTVTPRDATTPSHRIVEMLLSDARDEDVRDIVIRRSGPRVEVRFYRPGTPEYDIWGGFPPSVHLPIVNHFRRLAGLPSDSSPPEQCGIFRYHCGGGVTDVALRIQPGVSGPQIHLTILPHLAEPTVAVNMVA